jgi:uncharacterized protein (TIGR02466 family)
MTIKFEDKNTVFNLFPTTVNLIDLEDYSSIKDKVLSYVYEQQKNLPNGSPIKRSNRGVAWQSTIDYHEHNNILRDIVYQGMVNHSQFYTTNVGLKIDSLWININKKGGYNRVHDHPSSDLAGVFWIKVPSVKNIEDVGVIEFESPHSWSSFNVLSSLVDEYKESTFNNTAHYFNPVEGRMLIFPSHLKHRVECNQSDEDRISISFNLSITGDTIEKLFNRINHK